MWWRRRESNYRKHLYFRELARHFDSLRPAVYHWIPLVSAQSGSVVAAPIAPRESSPIYGRTYLAAQPSRRQPSRLQQQNLPEYCGPIMFRWTVVALSSLFIPACGNKDAAMEVSPVPREGSVASRPERPAANSPAQAPPPKSLSPQDVARQSLPSVLLIVVADSHAQPLAMGSGFVVKPGVVATNFHVIEGGSSAHATVTDANKPILVDGILGVDAEQDLALLKVSDLSAPPLTMDTTSDPEIGERVYAVGNPKGLQGTFSEGIVSAKRNVKTRTLLQITAPISPGSSGGPVLNKDGRVVGVATATLKDGQNLNFAVGVASLAALMNDIGDSAKPFPGPSRKKAAPPEGDAIASAVSFADFMWDKEYDFEGGTYTVTIRNKLHRPIKEVIALVVFYDVTHSPLETSALRFDDFIPSGLARMARGSVDGMLKVRVSQEIKSGTAYSRRPMPGRVELRLLDFQFAD